MLKTFAKVMSVILILGAAVIGVEFYMIQKANAQENPSPSDLKKWQVALPQILTNTGDGGVVQVTITVQAIGPHSAKDVTSDQSVILDGVNEILHTSTRKEFLSKSGLTDLEKSVTKRIQTELPHDTIKTVYITHIVEQ